MTEFSLHRDLEALAHLLGTWRGSGRGEYPNVENFSYEEEVTFTHSGRPVLVYRQRTWHPETGRAMHSEAGYWRPQPGGAIEMVVAHSFGVTEISEGRIEGHRIEVQTKSLASSTTAKTIKALARSFEVDGDVLTYELKMAYDDVPLQHHLGAELKRSA